MRHVNYSATSNREFPPGFLNRNSPITVLASYKYKGIDSSSLAKASIFKSSGDVILLLYDLYPITPFLPSAKSELLGYK